MRKLLAYALYSAANQLCAVAELVWSDDDYWKGELEAIYAYADQCAAEEDTGEPEEGW